VNLDFRSFQG